MTAKAGVLIVESDDNDLFLISRVFGKVCPWCQLFSLATAEEAILYLTGDPPYADRSKSPIPTLLIMDLKMTGIGGFALLEWLKGRPGLDPIAIVVLTGSEMPTDRERALELGAEEYYIKPHDYGEMERVLRDLVARWLTPPGLGL